MSEDNAKDYASSYQNYILRGLGMSYERQALDFEGLVIAERGESLATKAQLKKLHSQASQLLAKAFRQLSQQAQYKTIKPYLVGWSQEAQQAQSFSDLTSVLDRADALLFPPGPDEDE